MSALNAFIVCEGLDGAGKTTAIQHAMKNLDGVVYNKGLNGTWLGKLGKRIPITLLFLVDLVYQTYFAIKPSLKQGKTVIQDRYDLSVLSHPDTDKWYNRLCAALLRPFLLKPDVLVYFTVSQDERIKRLRKGPYNFYHRLLVENPDLISEREKQYQKLYDCFDGPKLTIDTTGKTIEQSVNELYPAIPKNPIL